MSIYQLINEIDSKEIVLPAIQRDFVWDTDRIRLLFDSIMRGYPVGIILLWETYQPIQFRYFDSHFTADALHKFHENPGDKRMKLVLDGQQRLSSISVALRGRHEQRGLYLDVLSGREKDDYSEEKFDFQFFTAEEATAANAASEGPSLADHMGTGEVGEEGRRFYVHVPEIIGRTPADILKLREKLSKRLSLSETDKLRMEGNLLNLSHALTGDEEILKTQTIDSKLPSDDQKRKSAFDILEIFVRINTQGVRLSRSDLIVSMLRLYWKEASDVLPSFIKEINQGNGLGIDNDFVIRCMFSTAGIGTRLDFDLLRKQSNVDKVRKAYKTCFDAIRAAVDFVRTDCHVDSSRLIGGISTLVPFVQYLFYAPKQSFPKGSKLSATKALYLFAFSKIFTQHSESRTGAFIKDVLPSAKDIHGGAPFPYDGSLQFVHYKSNFDTAGDRLFANNTDLALALIQERSDGKIKHADNLPEIDHIFAQAILYDRGLEKHEVNDLGNLWILPRNLNRNKSAKHPKTYLKDVEKAFLRTAFIDLKALDLRTYKSFVANRRAAMAKKLREVTSIEENEVSEMKARLAVGEIA
jgi:uncharacterized protein with ParB-like and HNH nuclease domain